tara:strand:+ start:241 stop:723 length:483 start_codon:yes stop_codon:yes gene_type:complete
MVTYKHNFSPTHAIVKLVNGDELITTITKKTDAGITIAKPAQVLRIMMPTGQAMIQCANYLIFNNSNPHITINWQQIIYVTEDIDSEVIQHYDSFISNMDDDNNWSHEFDEEVYTEGQRVATRDDINEKMRQFWENEVHKKVNKHMQMLANIDTANNTIH